MELTKKISTLKSGAESQLHGLNTKEKTKNALLLPFFDALGYDPFDVREVEPGFAVELEEDEIRKVDYALKIDGSPAMLFQCEEAETDLDTIGGDLLVRHFEELEASIAVLTNGLTYRFYADFESGAEVDERPFLEFNLLDSEPQKIEELKGLTKPEFETEKVLSAAFERKYSRLLQDYFARQQASPDDHFVRFLAAQVCDGSVSEGLIERFQPIVQTTLQQFVTATGKGQRQAPSRTGDSIPPEEGEAELKGQEEEVPAGDEEDGTPEENGNVESGAKVEGDGKAESDKQKRGDSIAKEFASKAVESS